MTRREPGDELLRSLRERAKELNCLYQVEEILQDGQLTVPEILSRVVRKVPAGWYHPEHCHATISYGGDTFKSPDHRPCVTELCEQIVSGALVIGRLCVGYSVAQPHRDEGPFLREERKLIRTLASRIGQMLLHRRLEPLFKNDRPTPAKELPRENWRAVMEMLRLTEQELYRKVLRKLLNHLCYLGIEEARALLPQLNWGDVAENGEHEGVNHPSRRRRVGDLGERAEEIFHIAQEHLADDVLHGYCQNWIMDHRVDHLLDVLEDSSTHLADVVKALSRFVASGVREEDLSESTRHAVRVSLVRRFLSRRLEFIRLAKDLISLKDYHALGQRLIHPQRSNGYIGGKGAGLFVAMQVVRNAARKHPELTGIKTPRTWYVTSDAVVDFIHHNHLEELLEHKYRDIGQIRLEYPNLVSLFKSCTFSSQMVTCLSMALDDFGDRPLVVRSSSLLEDGSGAAFSGKYKSLFLANQGSKRERLEALLDAIAEVYASMYGPDPIQYRKERGLLDYPEEMGLLIQEVVGTRVGKYLFPAFAGVAFSHNEFRWSPRIQRSDGLVRLVPGLGTRAVDRVGDDYPVLVAPGQPRLRVNVSMDEVVRYSPRYLDVINLEANAIETVRLDEILTYCGTRMPRLRHVYSRITETMLQWATGLVDPAEETLLPTFDALIEETPFIARIRTLLRVLQDHYGVPVDLEFASDDRDFYLLQCRPQSSAIGVGPVELPANPAREDLLFESSRHVSTARVQSISHVVYVSPAGYDSLTDLGSLRRVGRVVGQLNELLPRRQFVLIGPGRWGSRGDIKLGVNVTYSDICNTAALVEVAFRRGGYQPELSFGTHFFQDLVEANIAYLPLYPDDRGQYFAHKFLEEGENLLGELLPDAADLADVVRVVDIARMRPGHVLEILANGDEGRALGRLVQNDAQALLPETSPPPIAPDGHIDPEGHWLWRQRMAERMAAELDGARFGVAALYLIGSTKNATAGPSSDLDLLVHFCGNESQRACLEAWFDGWSKSLDEANFLRTGERQGDLLDVHFISDSDIASKQSFAAKVGALSDAARPLRLRSAWRRSE